MAIGADAERHCSGGTSDRKQEEPEPAREGSGGMGDAGGGFQGDSQQARHGSSSSQ